MQFVSNLVCINVFGMRVFLLIGLERIEMKKRIVAMHFCTQYAEYISPNFAKGGRDMPKKMKTHTRHKLIFDVLPIALKGLGSPLVYKAIVDLSCLL